MYAYVGSRTTRERQARGEGISIYRYDPATAALQPVEIVRNLVNPSFLAINARKDRLYTVHGDMTDISAFAIDPHSGKLSFINQQSTQGKNPVHLAIDPTGRYMVACNHIGATLAVLPLAADGSLEPVSQLVRLEGQPGPHRIEQKQAKPHFSPFDPDGRHVVVPDKGLDRIFSFRFEDGRLRPAQSASVKTRETSGPRHIAFHPRLPTAYCINELDSTVTTYRYDARTGELTPLQILSALPSTYTGDSRAAEIEVSRDGRYVYASNRGYDSIAVFSADPGTGLLAFDGATPSGGRTPRYTTLTPDGRHLFALNEDSDTIVAFAIDQRTGMPVPTGQEYACGSPVCMVFA
ncbi:lactonase family protein [Achromobacter aloeverae]|uniref:Hemagglutinin n=1 Tax=Achromobacter aloeverae TaxID=1750518 RepID=A0A4Q1HPC4_9BURK|nr:lactonase family protein [Achromobacter aloeverae]RXN92858.1 hemagglutinin [Achromobacter aloeverae]